MVAIRPKVRELDPAFESRFEAITKAAFSYRRKKLSNSLARDSVIGAIAYPLLARAGIDGSRRAEELSVQEFEHLASIYHVDFNL
jgi:16S rRNA (adenine1518-N6/adenine1519-N6)-dimethyltransferase